jgi:hypothetical protein
MEIQNNLTSPTNPVAPPLRNNLMFTSIGKGQDRRTFFNLEFSKLFGTNRPAFFTGTGFVRHFSVLSSVGRYMLQNE